MAGIKNWINSNIDRINAFTIDNMDICKILENSNEPIWVFWYYWRKQYRRHNKNGKQSFTDKSLFWHSWCEGCGRNCRLSTSGKVQRLEKILSNLYSDLKIDYF